MIPSPESLEDTKCKGGHNIVPNKAASTGFKNKQGVLCGCQYVLPQLVSRVFTSESTNGNLKFQLKYQKPCDMSV